MVFFVLNIRAVPTAMIFFVLNFRTVPTVWAKNTILSEQLLYKKKIPFCRISSKIQNKTYHTVGTVLRFNTKNIIAVRIALKFKTKNTILSEQF
jgi:hypothetical protein